MATVKITPPTFSTVYKWLEQGIVKNLSLLEPAINTADRVMKAKEGGADWCLFAFNPNGSAQFTDSNEQADLYEVGAIILRNVYSMLERESIGDINKLSPAAFQFRAEMLDFCAAIAEMQDVGAEIRFPIGSRVRVAYRPAFNSEYVGTVVDIRMVADAIYYVVADQDGDRTDREAQELELATV